MEEQLISFETAKLAKEKGFNIFCGFIYPLIDFMSYEEGKGKEFKEGTLYEYTFMNKEKVIFAPTQSLLQKWLREKHDIDCESLRCLYEGKFYSYQIFKSSKHITGSGETMYNSYELALEAGLQEALKLIN